MRGSGNTFGRLASIVAVVALIGGGALSATAADASSELAGTPPLTGPVETDGAPVDVVTGLDVPWSILQLHDAHDTVLVSERDTGVIERITSAGGLDPLATVPGVQHNGEGGLLGLATLVDGGTRWIYAYLSTATDNRIVRMVYSDAPDPADATLGTAQVILSGLKLGTIHDGGRIAFGPDGMLYATVGDTGDRSLPQKKSSLNGKILRMTPTGGVPSGNPFPGSLVYSLGHRNPQGLAWDADGQLWESELGQNTWDEFNKIVPGGNYGWPVVEGRSTDKRYINPWLQWHTDDASPSGLAYVDGTFFMAALRGTRLWTIHVDKAGGTAWGIAAYTNTLGRIRDVTAGPGDSLWMLTNNTSRGVVQPGDDRIVQVGLVDSGTVQGSVDCASCPLAGSVKLRVTLQRQSSGTWATFQTTTVTGGAGGFTFPAVWAGTYRIVVSDIGGDSYRTYTGSAFTTTKGAVTDQGLIRLTGAQLDRDLTGDGRNDLLAVTGGALVRFDGKAGGGFDAPQTVAATWDAAATAQAGDFDGDGAADLVTRDAAGALWLLPGDGAGAFLSPIQLAPAATGQTLLIGPGDWDGDGHPDLITRDTSGKLWLRSGHGQDPLGDPKKIGSNWSGLTVVATGDLTGDGRPDLLARTAKGDVRLYPGNGAGSFRPYTRIAHGWTVYTALLSAGDVSGDGRGDLIVRSADGTLRVYRGNGKTIAAPPVRIGINGAGLTFTS